MPPSAPRLALHDWASLQSELIWIYDHAPAEKSRHLADADHTRGNWAWFMRKGSVRIESAQGTFAAGAGEWLLLPAERHRHDFSDDASLISIHFICRWPTGENVFVNPAPLVLPDRDQPRLRQTATKLARLVGREFTGSHHLYTRLPSTYPGFLRFQRAFYDWLETWFETRVLHGAQVARQTGDPRVRQAVRLLEAAPIGNKLPKTALSSVGLGMVQLTRLFRQHLNRTPQQFWEYRRLEYARNYLVAGETPLKEIAFALGFSDVPHFNVWFKRLTGQPPGQFRSQNRFVA